MEKEAGKLQKGSGYEARTYEFPINENESVLIHRYVDIDKDESLYFGQAQIVQEVVQEMMTPQGPVRIPVKIPQTKRFPIEGATSPKNAFELSKAAFDKFIASMNSGIIAAPAGALPPPPKPPKKNGNGPVPGGIIQLNR